MTNFVEFRLDSDCEKRYTQYNLCESLQEISLRSGFGLR